MKLGEFCTEDFFNSLGVALGESDVANFIIDNKNMLHISILLNYNMDILSELEEQQPAFIATNFIAPKYRNALKRIYDTLYVDYSALNNTDVTTTENYEQADSNEKTFNSHYDKSGSDESQTSGDDEFESHVTNDTTDTSFTTYDDTANYRPTSKNNYVNDSNNKTSYGKKDTMKYDSSESHLGSDSVSGEMNYEKSIHRVGNIGITPNQKLIGLELDLRMKNQFANYLAIFLVESLTSGVWTD